MGSISKITTAYGSVDFAAGGKYSSDLEITSTGSATGESGSTLEHVGFGARVDYSGGTLTNYGSIMGGDSTGMGVSGGDGAEVLLGTLDENGGDIRGGSGVNMSGTGVVLSGGTVNIGSSGEVVGGYGSGSVGRAGVGVSESGGKFVNNGRLFGGADREGTAGVGGTGLYEMGGTATNNSIIYGGYGFQDGGAGADLTAGTLTNTDEISGANVNNATGGGVGVVLNGGTLVTSGEVRGGIQEPGDLNTYAAAVQFGAAASTLTLEHGAKFVGDITGFRHGDTIDATNLTPTQVAADFGVSATAAGGGVYFFRGSSAGETLTTTASQDEGTLVLTGNFSSEYFILAPDGHGGTDVTVSDTPCFRRGTRILGERGEVAVESLKIGDRVATLSGVMRPIRWIGRRSYSGELATGDSRLLPIRIRAGALDEASPKRDLWVSPEHAMYVDGMLIPAAALVNGESIIQEDAVDELTYIHLEFDGHTVIFAEGAPSESFVDDDSRQMFDNAAEYARLYPDAMREPVRFCAPRVEEGWELQAVRQRLGRRTEVMRMPTQKVSFDGGATTPPVSGAQGRLRGTARNLGF
jgi:hypothetical protein